MTDGKSRIAGARLPDRDPVVADLFDACLDWLEQIVPPLGASAAVVLVTGPGGVLQAVAGLPAGDDNLARLTATVQLALRTRVLQQVTAGTAVQVAVPVYAGAQILAVAAFEFAGRRELGAAATDLLAGRAGALAAIVWRGRAEAAEARVAATLDAFDVLAVMGEHEDLHGAALALANELRARFAAERVSVGVLRGSRGAESATVLRLAGVSDTHHPRESSALASDILNVMEEALDFERVVIWPDPGGLVPGADQPGGVAMTVAHRAHVERAGGGTTVASFPLYSADRPAGALTVEFDRHHLPDPQAVARLEAIAALAGPMIALLDQQDRLVSGWIPRRLRALWQRIFVERRPTHVLGALGIVMLVAASLFPVPLRLSAEATLVGAAQRAATAPFDGFLVEAAVSAGDTVEAGQVMARLDDKDLRLDISRWTSRHAQLTGERRVALAERNPAQIGLIDAQLAEARAELALARAKLDRTDITAPIAGIVVSGDLRQRLGAPLREGDLLFEIAPADAYRVEMVVRERDVDLVPEGGTGEVMFGDGATTRLPFAITRIGQTASTRDGLHGFLAEAVLSETLPGLRPGLQGLARIEAGRGPAAAVWTRDLRNWLRMALWRWMP